LPNDILNTTIADLIAFPVELFNGVIFIPKIDFSLKIRNTLPHQGCFYHNTTELWFD